MKINNLLRFFDNCINFNVETSIFGVGKVKIFMTFFVYSV